MKASAPAIRVRLTAWYALVLSVMLILYASATFVAVRHEFLDQLDNQLHDDFETAEDRLARSVNGQIVDADKGHHDPDSEEDRAYDLWLADGRQLHRSGASLPMQPAALAASTSARYETVVANGQRWRTLAGPATTNGLAVTLRVARSEERLRHQLQEILTVLALGLPLAVSFAGAGGYVLARRALNPIDRLASEARRITAERLHERLPVPNQIDEIGRLAAVINDTFARLESSFDQLRRFTADASHELRTPLAVVRGIGEASLAGQRDASDYRDAIGTMLEEIDRLTNLVETLLRLSHGDAGTIRLAREPIDLGRLAAEVVSSLGILAEERTEQVALTISDAIVLSADRLVLREAVTNVLDNAIKYSPDGSTVSLRVERAADQALFAVADEGRASRWSTANASFIASFDWTMRGLESAAGPGSGSPSRNGPSRSMEARSSSTIDPPAAPNSGSSCRC